MLIRIPRGWELPDSAATPEPVFLARRRFVAGLAAGSILAAAPVGRKARAEVPWTDSLAEDPSASRYPVNRNLRYRVERPITDEEVNGTYNNFYEFGSHKEIWRAAQKLRIRPWQVRIDGMVEKEMTLDIDDLLSKVTLEERVYRHRCVEAWSMIAPWSGFPMKQLVELARPLGSAKYVEMATFNDPGMAPGLKQFWYPWPYIEGLTIAEATNDLSFLVTGAYGKPLAKQHGAPLRLATPWKYGFKAVKSIVRFTFTDSRPKTFWETVQGSEYGFWANVNPEVSHPRWSQASERVLGTGERIPSKIYNGYGEFVAGLYTDLAGERLFM
jgi:sulfoxide reductase catalytic subunit YedY